MGNVRHLKEGDIEQVIALNKKLFPASSVIPDDTQYCVYRNVCLCNPWYDEELSSLVHVEPDGTINGFLGVVPRPLQMGERQYRAAIFQHLMVDRSTLASVSIFKTLLSGPQDLSMGENAIDVVRRIWERMNNPVSRINSIYWRKLLRPVSSGAAKAHRRSSVKPLLSAMMPMARLVDSALCRLPVFGLRYEHATVADEEMDARVMLAAACELRPACSLHPVYTEASLSWLMDTLGRETRNGVLRKKIVRTASGSIAGSYVYYLHAGGTSLVYQIAGTDAAFGCVLEHLFTDADRGGSFALVGRLEPRCMKQLTDAGCLFMPGRNWMLVHSKHPELLYAINSGDAFLSRMEGDLWVL